MVEYLRLFAAYMAEKFSPGRVFDFVLDDDTFTITMKPERDFKRRVKDISDTLVELDVNIADIFWCISVVYQDSEGNILEDSTLLYNIGVYTEPITISIDRSISNKVSLMCFGIMKYHEDVVYKTQDLVFEYDDKSSSDSIYGLKDSIRHHHGAGGDVFLSDFSIISEFNTSVLDNINDSYFITQLLSSFGWDIIIPDIWTPVLPEMDKPPYIIPGPGIPINLLPWDLDLDVSWEPPAPVEDTTVTIFNQINCNTFRVYLSDFNNDTTIQLYRFDKYASNIACKTIEVIGVDDYVDFQVAEDGVYIAKLTHNGEITMDYIFVNCGVEKCWLKLIEMIYCNDLDCCKNCSEEVLREVAFRRNELNKLNAFMSVISQLINYVKANYLIGVTEGTQRHLMAEKAHGYFEKIHEVVARCGYCDDNLINKSKPCTKC